MGQFEVVFTETRRIKYTCIVEAQSEEDAKKKAIDWEHIHCDDGDDGITEDAEVTEIKEKYD